jgi:hypothetical protein
MEVADSRLSLITHHWRIRHAGRLLFKLCVEAHGRSMIITKQRFEEQTDDLADLHGIATSVGSAC